MLGRVLFQDTNCIVAAGLFGGYRVLDLQRNATHKLTSSEIQFIDAVVKSAQRDGMPVGPANPVLAGFFQELASAVIAHRLGHPAYYNVFFGTTSPDELGRVMSRAYQEGPSSDR